MPAQNFAVSALRAKHSGQISESTPASTTVAWQ